MMKWLKRLIAKEEIEELDRWRIYWHQHRQWFSEFPPASVALESLYADVHEKENQNIHATRDQLRQDLRNIIASTAGEDAHLDAVKSTGALAWGWLWHVTTTDTRINTARHILGQMLDKKMKRYGIQASKAEGAQVNVHEIEHTMFFGE